MKRRRVFDIVFFLPAQPTLPPEVEDAEAIAEDWRAVGADLRTAIEDFVRRKEAEGFDIRGLVAAEALKKSKREREEKALA